MFLLHCPTCDEDQLVSSSSVKSVHTTKFGVVGFVNCPNGHSVLHNFTTESSMGTANEMHSMINRGELQAPAA